MEKFKQYWPILIFILVITIAYIIGNNRSEKEADTFDCKFEEITPELVREIGGEDLSEEMIKQINDETSYCKDLCLEELSNARQYPDEWHISGKSRALCEKAGIVLPN